MSTVDRRAFARVTADAAVLDNALRVVLLPQPGAESVAVALAYTVGARDEGPGEEGLAHFLEHMMFKGSASYGPGAIDRATQRLGGTNNAFTSHDATVYHFRFARGCWEEALHIEVDRMRGLSLLPEEVEREREVILEEIRMVEDDPWDGLEQAIAHRIFGDHPYARPVLGSRDGLAAHDAEALHAFHGRHCRPDRAVLVCAGGLPADAMSRIEATLGRAAVGDGDGVARPALAAPQFPSGGEDRIRLDGGDTPRLMVAHPAPPPNGRAALHLRLAVAVLGSGRSSRTQRALVEENPLALWTQAAVTGHRLGGMSLFTAEANAGAAPERLEAALCVQVDGLSERPPDAHELERAKRILLADWVFLHQRPGERAITAALEHALFRPGFSRDSFRWLREATAADVVAASVEWLSPRTRVVGWSLPGAAGSPRAGASTRSAPSRDAEEQATPEVRALASASSATVASPPGLAVRPDRSRGP